MRPYSGMRIGGSRCQSPIAISKSMTNIKLRYQILKIRSLTIYCAKFGLLTGH
jgi:hypothetical protein